MKVTATYSVKKWEEKTYEKMSVEKKLRKASAEFEYSGLMMGLGKVEYLMCYTNFDMEDQSKSAATYIGLIHFTGKLNGKEGSFIMEDRGTFLNGAANSQLKIIDASGTGDLQAISGVGRYRANHEGFHVELDYTLP